MSDQAERLRQLVGATTAQSGCDCRRRVDGRRVPPTHSGNRRGRAHSLLFTSGKGGVGTSNLVLNLAIALGEMDSGWSSWTAISGWRISICSAGSTPRYDLGDVLLGRCELSDAVVPGPCGIQVVPGAHASRTSIERSRRRGRRGWRTSSASSGSTIDFVLIDAGSGLGAGRGMLAAAADQVVVVSTPEPTSLADAHAAISRFHQSGTLRAARARQPGRIGGRGESRSWTESSTRAGSSKGRWSHRWDRVRSGRSARADGGPRPASVRDGVSGGGRFARRAANRPGRLSGSGIRPLEPQRPGFRAAIAARWRFSLAVGG